MIGSGRPELDTTIAAGFPSTCDGCRTAYPAGTPLRRQGTRPHRYLAPCCASEPERPPDMPDELTFRPPAGLIPTTAPPHAVRLPDEPKPVLLLDVDGVLNAVGTEPPEGVWPRWERTEPGGFGIIWSPDVIDRLFALRDRVEVRWLTTHWSRIADLPFPAEALGWPVANSEADYRRDVGPLGWWKWPVARRTVEEEGRRVVWVDDDLRFDRPARTWVAEQDPRTVLGVSPDTTVGLTPEQLDAVEAWL